MIKTSVCIVTLNSGDELLNTVRSVLEQKNVNFEIIIKDGQSEDGSIEKLPRDERIQVFREKDLGIYDAMNQAISYVSGDIAVFLNCGDYFFDQHTLERVVDFIEKNHKKEAIYYGDCFTVNRNCVLRYPDRFDDYTCFTKVLCHQSTFYSVNMLRKRGYTTYYKMAADYEYYVQAYTNGCNMIHIPMTIVKYQGNGASETKANRVRSIKEGKQIRKQYFIGKRYWMTYIKTLVRGYGIKQFMVSQEWFYPYYKKIAEIYYRIKNMQ